LTAALMCAGRSLPGPPMLANSPDAVDGHSRRNHGLDVERRVVPVHELRALPPPRSCGSVRSFAIIVTLRRAVRCRLPTTRSCV